MVEKQGRRHPRTVPASQLMDRLEIEVRAQRAAKEELEAFFEEVVVMAERHGQAARFLGGNWFRRWQRLFDHARDALNKQRVMSMQEHAVVHRRARRERRNGHAAAADGRR